MIDLHTLKTQAQQYLDLLESWAHSPEFYAQVGLIAAAIIGAMFLAGLCKRIFKGKEAPAQAGTMESWRRFFRRLGALLLPFFILVLLGIGVAVSDALLEQSWVIRIAQSLSVVWLIYKAITLFVEQHIVKLFAKWIILPIAVLYVFGWLDDITTRLDAIRLELGNISVSLLAIMRVLIFGSVLFWFGRKSNDTGKQFIRKQEQIEIGTREVFAKLFEIAVFLIIFLLILQVMGINITTLAVFGGALGVGLGFGLQSIASNFISGMIILIDRSITVGDYVELEDGQSGNIRALNMRSAILETYDGKDIVVPNETFITSTFINWTHKDVEQRYSMEFQIAYSSDVEHAIEVIREVVQSHPQVIDEPDTPMERKPDAEIAGFGDSGVDILVEFWMAGIDDGKNRVAADLYMMIWKAFKEHNIEIPFPQREVRLMNNQFKD